MTMEPLALGGTDVYAAIRPSFIGVHMSPGQTALTRIPYIADHLPSRKSGMSSIPASTI